MIRSMVLKIASLSVLKKDFTRRGGKLDYRWEGPFIITKSLGKGLYQLKEQNGSKVCNRGYIVHACIIYTSDFICLHM